LHGHRSGGRIVKLIKCELVTLARLDCIPTPAHGNEKKCQAELEKQALPS